MWARCLVRNAGPSPAQDDGFPNGRGFCFRQGVSKGGSGVAGHSAGFNAQRPEYLRMGSRTGRQGMSSAMPQGVPGQYPGLQPLRPSAARAGWNAGSPNGTAEAAP